MTTACRASTESASLKALDPEWPIREAVVEQTSVDVSDVPISGLMHRSKNSCLFDPPRRPWRVVCPDLPKVL
jgi:hypothetical protein